MTTPNMAERIGDLCGELARLHPEAVTDVHWFPSGAMLLDVRKLDRLFVLSYRPTHGYAVDEVKSDEGFLPSYRFRYADLNSATTRLKHLVFTTNDEHAECHASSAAGCIQAEVS